MTIAKPPANHELNSLSNFYDEIDACVATSFTVAPPFPLDCNATMFGRPFPPGLPMKRGRCGTWTYDYVRNGTTTLFAALNVAAGRVSGRCFPRHRHQEFLRFLRQIDAEYALELELHLVMDNYGTHNTDQVKRWLKRHPRFKVHFIPTSSSWLNMVERWFAELTGNTVRRGSFSSVPDLIAAIEEFIEEWNRDPKPFIWTARAEDILEKIERCRRRLEEIKPGCTVRRGRKKVG